MLQIIFSIWGYENPYRYTGDEKKNCVLLKGGDVFNPNIHKMQNTTLVKYNVVCCYPEHRVVC